MGLLGGHNHSCLSLAVRRLVFCVCDDATSALVVSLCLEGGSHRRAFCRSDGDRYLFAMLAAAGLSGTWMFRKTRILVIFDDLDTVLLMIPLKILMVGLAWQLGIVAIVLVALLWVAWHWLHRVSIPISWPWVLAFSILIAAISEAVYWGTRVIVYRVAIHLEVLLPAFVLGSTMKRPAAADPHADDTREGHQEGPETKTEQRVSTLVSAAFMMLAGVSMPVLFADNPTPIGSNGSGTETIAASLTLLVWHIVALTVLINVGKMVPAFCYRREAHWKERLAVALAMCPRGVIGAGIILLSLDYGIGGPIVSVAVLSLTVNLILTPVFIYAVNVLVRTVPGVTRSSSRPASAVAEAQVIRP